jgi:hypothetical protein
MARKNWDRVAKEQFESMPADYRDSWQDLRSKRQ